MIKLTTVIDRIKNLDWWKAAAARAVKTMAQAALSYAGTSAVLWEVNWQGVVGAALLGGLTSLLTSLAGLPEVAETGVAA
ncbi:MAG: holin [Clostridiales bacterium]|nr:holin [Clostridiales bacterium]